MLDKNKHEVVLKKILLDIYKNRDLAPLLGFKGGTACYLLYNLSRFSTDLDFDLLDVEKADFVYQKIKSIIGEYGAIKDERKKFFTIYFMLSYNPNLQNIKIEVSIRQPAKNSYEIVNFLGNSMPVLTKDCMVSNKLIAITDRPQLAGRDIFDAYFFLKNDWPINEEIIKERLGKSPNDYFAELIVFLRKIKKDYKILQGLGELVEPAQKAFIKNKLIDELITLLEIYQTS